MATIKLHVQTYSSLTITGATLPTLASAAYANSSIIDHSTNDPFDVLVEVTANTTGTVSGNKQLLVFAKGSIDGTNFGSGPESGATSTDEPDLHYVGSLPMNTNNMNHKKIFSLATAYGGTLPMKSKIIFKNDLGTALTSGTANIAEVWGVSA